MPKQRSRIIVVLTPDAYKVFEKWLKQHPQKTTEPCSQHSPAGQQTENKEVGHERSN